MLNVVYFVRVTHTPMAPKLCRVPVPSFKSGLFTEGGGGNRLRPSYSHTEHSTTTTTYHHYIHTHHMCVRRGAVTHKRRKEFSPLPLGNYRLFPLYPTRQKAQVLIKVPPSLCQSSAGEINHARTKVCFREKVPGDTQRFKGWEADLVISVVRF